MGSSKMSTESLARRARASRNLRGFAWLRRNGGVGVVDNPPRGGTTAEMNEMRERVARLTETDQVKPEAPISSSTAVDDRRRPNTPNTLMQLMLFDECGEYEIYQTFLHAAHKSDDDARFGIRFKTLDRVPKLLEHVFPGYTAYSHVALVTKDSLAAKVGVRRHDILCWVDLDGCNSSPCRRVKGGGAMMLFTAAEFADYIRRLRGQAVLPLYIARRRRVNRGNHHDCTSFATTGNTTSATTSRKRRHLEVESVPSGGFTRQELPSPPVMPCRVGSGSPPSKQRRLDLDPGPMEVGTGHDATKAEKRDKDSPSVSNQLATFTDAGFPSQEAIQKGTIAANELATAGANVDGKMPHSKRLSPQTTALKRVSIDTIGQSSTRGIAMYAIGPSQTRNVQVSSPSGELDAAPAAASVESIPSARARPTEHSIFSESESDDDDETSMNAPSLTSPCQTRSATNEMSANDISRATTKVAARQDIDNEPAAQKAASVSTSKRPQENKDVVKGNIAAVAAASDKMPAVPVPNDVSRCSSKRPQENERVASNRAIAAAATGGAAAPVSAPPTLRTNAAIATRERQDTGPEQQACRDFLQHFVLINAEARSSCQQLIDDIGRVESEQNKITDSLPQLLDHPSNEAETNQAETELLELPQKIEMPQLNVEDEHFYRAVLVPFIDALKRQTEELRDRQQHLATIVQRRKESLATLQEMVQSWKESFQSWRRRF